MSSVVGTQICRVRPPRHIRVYSTDSNLCSASTPVSVTRTGVGKVYQPRVGRLSVLVAADRLVYLRVYAPRVLLLPFLSAFFVKNRSDLCPIDDVDTYAYLRCYWVQRKLVQCSGTHTRAGLSFKLPLCSAAVPLRCM